MTQSLGASRAMIRVAIVLTMALQTMGASCLPEIVEVPTTDRTSPAFELYLTAYDPTISRFREITTSPTNRNRTISLGDQVTSFELVAIATDDGGMRRVSAVGNYRFRDPAGSCNEGSQSGLNLVQEAQVPIDTMIGAEKYLTKVTAVHQPGRFTFSQGFGEDFSGNRSSIRSITVIYDGYTSPSDDPICNPPPAPSGMIVLRWTESAFSPDIVSRQARYELTLLDPSGPNVGNDGPIDETVTTFIQPQLNFRPGATWWLVGARSFNALQSGTWQASLTVGNWTATCNISIHPDGAGLQVNFQRPRSGCGTGLDWPSN